MELPIVGGGGRMGVVKQLFWVGGNLFFEGGEEIMS